MNPDPQALVPILSEQMFDVIPVGTAIFAYFPPHPPFAEGYYRVYKVADLPASGDADDAEIID